MSTGVDYGLPVFLVATNLKLLISYVMINVTKCRQFVANNKENISKYARQI